MTMPGRLVRAARFAIVLGVAALAGVAVTIGSALLGHVVLVMVYGEDLAPIDDTLPMLVAAGGAYVAGSVSALVVAVLGWRRFVRHPSTLVGPRQDGQGTWPKEGPQTE